MESQDLNQQNNTEESYLSKLIKTTLLLVLIISILSGISFGLGVAVFGMDKVLSYIQGQFSVSLPPQITNSTGALQSTPPPDQNKAYTELYALLDKGDITQDSFSIHVIPQERRVEITVAKPIDQNLLKVQTWMGQNGYADIPPEKITYTEGK